MWGTYWRIRLVGGLVVSLFLFGLTLFGYNGRQALTKAHYDKVKIDMTLEEVEDALGEAACCRRSVRGTFTEDDDGDLTVENGEVKWEDAGKSLSVKFSDGKVVDKSQSGLK